MILIAYGTRPEYLKIKPLLNIFDKYNFKYQTLFTGQHTDLLKNIKFDQHINIQNGNNRLDSIISSIMNNVDFTNISYTLVQGDTTTALGVALSSFNHNIPIIHLEAGLRTYDNQNPYPEEQNRKLISQLANIHLCPTEQNKQILLNEKTIGDIYVTGNTVLDNLVKYKNNCEYTNKILITLHRRENHHWLKEWFTEINILAKEYSNYEFILPIHPNPNVQKYKHLLTNVNVIDPLSHDDLIKLLIKTKLVISDSGGLQEECSFFNKIILVCRKVTERSETLNKSSFLVKHPIDLKDLFDYHINNFKINYNCPYGNGNSSLIIYDILKNII